MSDVHTLQEEDGFHEIQLNGKQLVFLGMTTTLVSVVIFLCGVLVGRGVKPIEPVAEAATAQTASAEPVAAPETPAPEPAPAPAPAATAAAAAATPPAPADETPAATPAPLPAVVAAKPEPKVQAAAAKPADDLSYHDALSKGDKKRNKAAATATPAPAAAVKAPESVPTPVAEAPADAAPAASTAAAASPAPAAPRSGGAIAVQVAALTSRADAEAIARRLSGKGYAAYILSPDAGGKQVFKVRVGNYASADEAARVSRRLRQEEKLQPWVIR